LTGGDQNPQGWQNRTRPDLIAHPSYTTTVDRAREWYIAMAKLEALAAHIPSRISRQHVEEFHEILTLFADATGEDISIFRVPDDKMQRQPISVSRATRRTPGSIQWSEERYCDDNFFERRLEEVKLYFKTFQPPHKR